MTKMKHNVVFIVGMALAVSLSACSSEDTARSATESQHRASPSATQVGTYDPAEPFARPADEGHLIPGQPKSIEEFLTHQDLGSVVVGKAVSTEVLPIDSEGSIPETIVTVNVDRSSNHADAKPGTTVRVRYGGARTTRGFAHKLFSVKLKPNGQPESEPVSPDDKTPVDFPMFGVLPPQVDDEVLVFLEPTSPEYNHRLPVSGSRGAYRASGPGTNRPRTPGEYWRHTSGSDGHLAILTVDELNQKIGALHNSATTKDFKQQPL